MMHTLRNRKTGPENCPAAFHRSATHVQTSVYPDLAGAIRGSNANFQAFVGFKTRV
jgi:hypothetical protein